MPNKHLPKAEVGGRMMMKSLSVLVLILGCTNAFVFPGRSAFGSTTRTTFRSAPSTASTGTDIDPATSQTQKQQLLLTFDLDDTLFPIGPVVEDSNQKMFMALKNLGYRNVTLQDFLATTRSIRSSLESPITYSDLRMQAIEQSTWCGVTDDSVIQHIFDVWVQERHEAAERHLFDGCLDMLQDLKQSYGKDITIGAITNGRGNPLEMDLLQKHFDFCVSGEDEGVFPNRKPHAGIYQAALDRYQENYGRDIDFVWIHVGDCLANDVGASADVGARAVWIAPKENSASSRLDSNQKQPKWSTASQEEMEHRAQLAEAAKQRASAKITCLTQLPRVVENILKEETAAASGNCVG